jgi:hypothetical protein
MTDLGLLDLAADDGRGARSVFPTNAAATSGGCVVVHSGPVDAGFAPHVAGVVNLSATAGSPIAGVPAATALSKAVSTNRVTRAIA